MHCPNCGNKLIPNTTHCSECGFDVSDFNIQNSTEPTTHFKPAKQIKDDHNLYMFFALNVITFGLYSIYCYPQFYKDTNTICFKQNHPSFNPYTFVILSILTIGIYPIVCYISLANRLSKVLNVKENGLTIFMLWLLGLITGGITYYIGLVLIVKNINALASDYNKSHLC